MEPLYDDETMELDAMLEALPDGDEPVLEEQESGETPEPVEQDAGEQPAPAPDPYHGKSREDVIRENAELKAQLEAKLAAKQEQEQAPAKQEQAPPPPLPTQGDWKDATPEELEQMTTAEYDDYQKRRTSYFVQKTIREDKQRQETIHTRVEEARKQYPELDNGNFRNLAKRLIYASIAERKPISLLQACKEAKSILNIQPSEPQGAQGKLPPNPGSAKISIPTDAETGGGAPSGAAGTDEEQSLIHNALRPRNISPLGGLGF